MLVKSKLQEDHPLFTLISMIKNLLQHNWMVFVSHVLEEANKAADFYAGLGQEISRGCFDFVEPPMELGIILQ